MKLKRPVILVIHVRAVPVLIGVLALVALAWAPAARASAPLHPGSLLADRTCHVPPGPFLLPSLAWPIEGMLAVTTQRVAGILDPSTGAFDPLVTSFVPHAIGPDGRFVFPPDAPIKPARSESGNTSRMGWVAPPVCEHAAIVDLAGTGADSVPTAGRIASIASGGDRFAILHEGGLVYVFSWANASSPAKLLIGPGEQTSILLSPDGRFLATTPPTGPRIAIWTDWPRTDTATGSNESATDWRALDEVTFGFGHRVAALAFAPDARAVAVAVQYNEPIPWFDTHIVSLLPDGASITAGREDEGIVRGLSWGPSGIAVNYELAFQTENRVLLLGPTLTAVSNVSFPHEQASGGLAWSPDGNRLAVGSGSSTGSAVVILDANLTRVASFPLPNPPGAPRFAPPGTALCGDCDPRMWTGPDVPDHGRVVPAPALLTPLAALLALGVALHRVGRR